MQMYRVSCANVLQIGVGRYARRVTGHPGELLITITWALLKIPPTWAEERNAREKEMRGRKKCAGVRNAREKEMRGRTVRMAWQQRGDDGDQTCVAMWI